MNCDSARQSIPLYRYGELPPEEEEQLEQHVDGCADCRGELERQRRMAAALDARALEVPPALLAECRHDLMRSVYRGAAGERPKATAWASFRDGFAALFDGLAWMRQPGGAVALLALGWFAARMTAPGGMAGAPAPAQDVVYSSVRSVQPDTTGRVQISLDETRRRVVSGRC